jgi:signal transduction histidine kinase
MTIDLVSRDAHLFELCHDILSELPEFGNSLTLTMVSSEDGRPTADLYIWDFHPNLSLPQRLEPNPLRHLFLVERKDLSAFYERSSAVDGSVLLKPVSRATLATFLLPAASPGAARSLRADRDEILQCLIQTNLKLQEYDQDRTTFLARAVHDFRAPLTALRGYCGLLLSEPLGSLTESQREVLLRMQHSINRLSRMATAMFELSIGRHVKRQPELQLGNIRACVEQALHEVTPFADEKSLAITPDLEPCGEELYFEPSQIEQVLINILDNACKFTPRAGSIEIRGYPYFWDRRHVNAAIPPAAERRVRSIHEPNSYRIDISDSGAHIPEQHLSRIFEEYTSYAGGRDRSGGGLGLAICKMIIAQHDGRVWAENRPSGPSFSIVLPSRGDQTQNKGLEKAPIGGSIHAD